MKTPLFARAVAVAVVTAGATVIGGAGIASAAPAGQERPVQKQINAQLRAYPGGVQTGSNEVSYRAGSVKVVIPEAATRGTPDCPSGWYCFYQYDNWDGRRLQFRDCGGNQSLTDYGFGNRTTSWHNNSKNLVEVYDRGVEPFETLWREAAFSTSAFVGASKDNRADFFHTYCG